MSTTSLAGAVLDVWPDTRAVALQADHELCPAAEVFEVHDEVLRRLRYPGGGGMCGGAQDVDPATGVFDRHEHVYPYLKGVFIAVRRLTWGFAIARVWA
ncbi:hypothetical protein [Streptomyces sp. 6N106]|uniref:hypothetical protein n=1 Tax=Streptomyces sp. 6N106 TaxID=3457418 RepID=UPI003FD17BAF